MAITRKPAKPAEAQPVDVDALIRKGGSVAAEAETDAGKAAAVVLRIPAEAMARIDQAVQARRVKTPRHTWLLEAVMEKLDREAAE
jgi:ethanolamine utilization microcompartment shell protein EutL